MGHQAMDAAAPAADPGNEVSRGSELAMRRPLVLATAVVGIVLIAAAAVVTFAITPAVAKLPADTNTTRVYAGTAATLFNPAALAAGSTQPLLLHSVPIQIVHHVRVVQSTSATAVVNDTRTVTAAGQPVVDLVDRYPVDRTSLEAAGRHAVTFNFRVGVAKHDYQGWVFDTGTATTLRYVGTAKHAGVNTYVFTANVPATPITDKQVLATFPAVLPKAELPALAARLGVSPTLAGQLSTVVGRLPALVPLTYFFAATSTYWVAPDSGVIVDLRTTETRSVGLAGFPLPIATVAQFSYTDTPGTAIGAAHDATKAASGLTLVRTTVPLVLLLVGLGLLVVSAFTWLSGRRLVAPTAGGPPAEPTAADIPAPRPASADEPVQERR
jgi:hypothetical protein